MSNSRVSLDHGKRGEVLIVEDADALAQFAADLLVATASAAIAKRGVAHIVLSGGSTPQQLSGLLKDPPYQQMSFWTQTHFYWGDERWVPIESLHSNAGVAMRTLFRHVDVPPDHIHPMPTEGMTPPEAARSYAELIETLVPIEMSLPAFDLIFLGLGTDGHTASLFPHSPALNILDELVTENVVDAIDALRLTMTFPLLNAGRNVVFLVAGEAKAARLAEVLDGPSQPEILPAQGIRPELGRLQWIVDEAAAADLTILQNQPS